MAVIINKSASVTNWDASPTFIPTTGEGADGMLRCANDNTTQATTDSVGSTYRLVRIPTNAKIKRVIFNSVSIVAAAADFDIAFSDSPNESAGYQQFQSTSVGVVQLAAGDNKLFGAAATIAATTQKDVTFAGTFTLASQNIPLWQVLINLGATQFTADPGGMFDFLLKLTTISTTGGTVGIEIDYVE
jgi:hypothetical protein